MIKEILKEDYWMKTDLRQSTKIIIFLCNCSDKWVIISWIQEYPELETLNQISVSGPNCILSGLFSALNDARREKWSQYWENEEDLNQIQPQIKVQSIIGEGIGWEGPSMETSNHVIISVSGFDKAKNLDVPYAFN